VTARSAPEGDAPRLIDPRTAGTIGGLSPETPLRRHLVWTLVALAYLVVFPYFQRLNNPNENVRIWMTRAIVAHGTFAIDAVEREWGEVSDRATDGVRRFSGKAPGASLLGVPVHFIHHHLAGGAPSQRTTTWVLRVFTVALPLAVFFFLFARAVERETASPVARDLLVLGLGLGTMMYPYGLGFVGHAQAAALLFGGYLALPRRPALAGALAGLAVVFEYQALFAALALAGFAGFTLRRRTLRFALGGLGPAVLLGAYHTALFGRPWETPLAHVDDPVFRLYHQQGVLGFAVPRGTVLGKSLFALDYGLFVWSPLLLLGLVSAAIGLRAAERRPDRVLILGVTAVMLLFLSGMANWRGGWCAGGPRYVAVVVPFLIWSVALSWRRWSGRALPLLGGLVLASVVTCGLAGAHFPHYPLQFDDPLFDLTLPLMGAGLAPHSLGTLVGLRGVVSYLPLAAVFVAAAALALAPLGRRALLSVALAGALFAALGLANGRTTADERHATDVVRGVWEP
jgi:hypothetical protein